MEHREPRRPATVPAVGVREGETEPLELPPEHRLVRRDGGGVLGEGPAPGSDDHDIAEAVGVEVERQHPAGERPPDSLNPSPPRIVIPPEEGAGPGLF